ncbi:response regulator [Caballeronia pedi]|uniref:response regulator n=1 Tax=Caballeronia pedi TaxID=1777141 RepID=UPI0007729C9E|nr:response regulator [Caballeronia pedi]
MKLSYSAPSLCGKPTVLLIDDQEDIRAAWSMVLEAAGIAVITSADGEDGIRNARAHRPDVIICDFMMPGMDGLEACASIRSDETLRHAFIILWSAVPGLRANNLADLVIEKPVDVESFLKLIRDVGQH